MLKFQHFGHLMRTADSLEKTLMLGKIEGKRRRGQQSIRWLDSIIDSMDKNLNKLREIVKDRETCHRVKKSQTQLSNQTTKQLGHDEHLKHAVEGTMARTLLGKGLELYSLMAMYPTLSLWAQEACCLPLGLTHCWITPSTSLPFVEIRVYPAEDCLLLWLSVALSKGPKSSTWPPWFSLRLCLFFPAF